MTCVGYSQLSTNQIGGNTSISFDKDLTVDNTSFTKIESQLNLFAEEIFEEEIEDENSHSFFFLISCVLFNDNVVEKDEAHYFDFISFIEEDRLFLKYCNLKIPSLS